MSDLKGQKLRELRTDLQMVFQDPHAALNPGMTLEEAIGHPLVIHGIAKGEELHRRVVEALEKVGLSPVERFLSKFPSDLSGGQKQRAVIARAIILGPEVLVADEPVSMLDMSVRAKILQLMLDLKQDLGLTYVYITHDLASAKYFCDRIAIMYLGRVVEVGPTEEIFANPRHPYTKALLAAIPEPDPERMVPRNLPRGEIPDAASPPLGCSFHPRCPEATRELRLGVARPAGPDRGALDPPRPGDLPARAGPGRRPRGARRAVGHRHGSARAARTTSARCWTGCAPRIRTSRCGRASRRSTTTATAYGWSSSRPTTRRCAAPATSTSPACST